MGEKTEQKSAATGFQAVVSRDASHFTRAFWAVALVLSVTAMTLSSFEVFARYNFKPDFGVKISQQPMREIPFPAITICAPVFARNDVVNYRKFGKFLDTTGKNLSMRQKNIFAANYQKCNPSNELGDQALVMQFLSNRSDFDTVRLLKESALKLEDMILICAIKGAPIECDKHFTRVLTDAGFCFAFNMQASDTVYRDVVSKSFKTQNNLRKKPIWTLDKSYPKTHTEGETPHRATKDLKFTVLLNLKRENAENFCPITGRTFVTILHLPNEMPTMFHKRFHTRFSFGRMSVLTATSHRANADLRGFPPKTRACYFQNERELKFFKVYTKSACDLECLTNYTLASCGCVKFSMPHESHTPICDIDQMKCYTHASDRWPERADKGEIACNCFETCNDIAYGMKYELDTAVDHTQDFIGSELRPVNSTDAVLSFRFVDHLVVEHRKFIAYRLENFIADIGGLLGLFLGCSLISFVEFFYSIGRVIIEKQQRQDRVEEININSNSNKLVEVLNELRNDQKVMVKRIQKLEQKNVSKLLHGVFQRY